MPNATQDRTGDIQKKPEGLLAPRAKCREPLFRDPTSGVFGFVEDSTSSG
jgi:hypothetical protein